MGGGFIQLNLNFHFLLHVQLNKCSQEQEKGNKFNYTALFLKSIS
jgi:hypothetical protein